MFKIIKNKKLRIFIIISLILIVLSAIVYFIVGRLKVNYRSFYNVGKEIVLEQTYNTIFNEIDIETKMTDIDIKKSSDNNIKVIIYGEKDYIKIKEKNNKLYINVEEKNFITFDFYKYISKVEIYLPNGYSKLIRIDNEYGNIKIEEFINCTFDIRQKYGDFLSLGADFIKIENIYGDIDLKQATKARIAAKAGDVNIDNIDDVVVENEYGDITIKNVKEYLKLHNESGDIKLDNISIIKDSFIDLEYGDIKIKSINDVYIDAKADYGELKVKNNNKDSEIMLKIHNIHGDIKINN